MDNARGPWKTMMRGYAEELASRGLFALIPDYFAKTGTPHGGPAVNAIIFRRADRSAALMDTVTHARTLPRVDASHIGMMGFSLGRYLCLCVRAAKPKALVEYFAPLVRRVPHVQIDQSTADEFLTQFSNATAIEGILKLEGPDVTLFSYKDPTHGFELSDSANASAAALAKSRTVAFCAAPV